MAAPAVYARGWLDTRNNLVAIFEADKFLTQLFSRNADLENLRRSPITVISACMTIAVHARYALTGNPLPSIDYLQSVVIGELMAPQLPQTHSLAPAPAQATLLSILNYLMANELTITRGRTVDVWIDQVNEARQPDAPARGRPETLADKLEYLVWLGLGLRPGSYYDPMTLVVTTFVSVAKRGNVTERFLDKIKNGIMTDLNREIDLSLDCIRLVYTNFGRYVNETNARDVFDTWLGDVPVHALRVRLTLQQVTGSGLTAFSIIGRAMSKYPNFLWAKCNLLTGGELANYNRAVTAVNGNAYYGFKNDLGAAKSTNFKSLAYIAKELLIRLNGETTLRQYQGWPRQPKSATIINKMIDDYVTQRTEEITNETTSDADAAIWEETRTLINNEQNVNLFA